MITGRSLANLFHLPSLNLYADADSCINCHSCTSNCPMCLAVEDMVNQNSLEDKECVLCGTCVDVCPKGVIHFSMKR